MSEKTKYEIYIDPQEFQTLLSESNWRTGDSHHKTALNLNKPSSHAHIFEKQIQNAEKLLNDKPNEIINVNNNYVN